MLPYQRQLGQEKQGKPGPVVSAMGLGPMGMSEFYGPTDEAQSVATIHRALDLGINFFDTADIYGRGHNERLLGKAIRGRRQEVFLATQFGNVRAPDGAFVGVNGRPEYLRSSCEASLGRLGVDVIDLYYQHRVDRRTPVEETVGAMAGLVQEGKVRYIGLSEASADELCRAHGVHPITALQSEYSLWTRAVEQKILPVCRELGIGFVAYSPLGRGMLTGRFQRTSDFTPGDRRLEFPRFSERNFSKNLQLVRRVEELAAEKRCRPSQLALAWLLLRGEDIIPIPGTRSQRYLEENLGAFDVKLSAEDLARIDALFPEGVAAGTRYSEPGMRIVSAEN